jgi:predicted glycoside hydrolase/deacetylase ChbG (UPF0249 family)
VTRQRVIVNADDFGLTSGVNRAVEEAHAHGVLTSTSVLVAGASAPEITEVSARFPELGVGLHVNLTFGRPTCAPEEVRSLVDEDGRFRPDVIRRALRREVRPEEVFREVSAQAARLGSLGVRADHWDSHQGVALWPVLVRPVAAAARNAGIRCTRSPHVWVIDDRWPPSLARWKYRLRGVEGLVADTAGRLAGVVLRRHFAMPDWRTSAKLAQRGRRTEYAHAWARTFEALPSGVSEIVSHPAHVDAELTQLDPSLGDERAVDLAVLADPASAADLEAAGVRFIRFADLLR